MPKATKPNTTNPSAAATDPVLKIAHEIERLWDAFTGAEIEQFAAKGTGEASTATLLREHCRDIESWREALELTASYTVATSVPGAVVQMAMMICELQSVSEVLELSKAGECEPGLAPVVERCKRMAHSAIDVMITALGNDYKPYDKIVTTYAVVGEPHLNWLNSIDGWIDQADAQRGRIEAAADAAGKEAA